MLLFVTPLSNLCSACNPSCLIICCLSWLLVVIVFLFDSSRADNARRISSVGTPVMPYEVSMYLFSWLAETEKMSFFGVGRYIPSVTALSRRGSYVVCIATRGQSYRRRRGTFELNKLTFPFETCFQYLGSGDLTSVLLYRPLMNVMIRVYFSRPNS